MMPIEIYIAVLVACTCIFLLTVAFVVAAMYFTARFNAMEGLVSKIDGGISGLIDESKAFAKKMKHVAERGNGVMQDIRQMSRTARGWTDRADRAVDVVTHAAEPSKQFVAKNLRFGSGFLSGVMQDLLAPDKERSLTRSIDMSERNNGSDSSSMIMAFGAGALIGAGMALLFAPQSGKETRDQVRAKSHDFKDTADDVIDRGKHLVNEVKHDAREAFEKGKKVAHEKVAQETNAA